MSANVVEQQYLSEYFSICIRAVTVRVLVLHQDVQYKYQTVNLCKNMFTEQQTCKKTSVGTTMSLLLHTH